MFWVPGAVSLWHRITSMILPPSECGTSSSPFWSKLILLAGLYCYPTLVRDVATWGKVKQSSDGLKKLSEMFDTAADSNFCRATPLVQDILVTASRTGQTVLHLATQERLETQETAANLVALRVREPRLFNGKIQEGEVFNSLK